MYTILTLFLLIIIMFIDIFIFLLCFLVAVFRVACFGVVELCVWGGNWGLVWWGGGGVHV